MKTLPVLLSLLLIGGGASAQTVYRCGPDGRTYSQSPCPAGQAVDVSDVRSDAQRREAAQVVNQQAALGESMEDERRHRESIKPAAAVRLGAAPSPQASASSAGKSSKKKKSRRHASEGDNRPVVVVPPKASKPAKSKN